MALSSQKHRDGHGSHKLPGARMRAEGRLVPARALGSSFVSEVLAPGSPESARMTGRGWVLPSAGVGGSASSGAESPEGGGDRSGSLPCALRGLELCLPSSVFLVLCDRTQVRVCQRSRALDSLPAPSCPQPRDSGFLPDWVSIRLSTSPWPVVATPCFHQPLLKRSEWVCSLVGTLTRAISALLPSLYWR